jgi:hypothetical protein
MSNTIYDERLALLQAIATDVLGIDKLEPTAKPTADFRIVNVEHLIVALEAAYDAGLVVGRRVAREGNGGAQPTDEVYFP